MAALLNHFAWGRLAIPAVALARREERDSIDRHNGFAPENRQTLGGGRGWCGRGKLTRQERRFDRVHPASCS